MVIEFKVSGKGKMPTQAYTADAGYDLYVSRKVTIAPKTFVDVHTDISGHLPDGIWGRITGRSSTLRKHGLQVQEGIIDNGYRGELFVGVWNLTDKPVTIEIGHRIAQIILHNSISVRWIKVKKLKPSDRNTKSFGSSGK